ncbi:trypsin-like peptidase domain-containing protein [Desulfotomaculum sp. 1211_IL3151]|uniref:trypsin-like peptidase domain-containing protein n=1 Tax=Desulfotomaculum sp. 1211_IL3151 TaxID=3084055 RepID=UPI002FD9E367
MRKTPLTLILLTIITILFGITAFPSLAKAEISIVINNSPLHCDTPPQTIKGSMFVPLRAILNGLSISNQNIRYKNGVILIHQEPTKLKLTIDSLTATVNGKNITLSVPPTVIQGQSYVPLRFIAESFEAEVNWDDTTNAVYITTAQNRSPQSKMDTVKVAQNEPSVVTVFCTDQATMSQGSGVIISPDGLLLTNYHVIDGYDTIRVLRSNGTQYPVSVVKYDEGIDIAILKIYDANLKPALIGDSDDLRLGEEVMAIGSPEGLQNTISTGIVSGIPTIQGIQLIQTTTPITHGSHGGGLFNRHGQLIGITFAGGEGNLNFAIPINAVKDLLANIRSFKPLIDLEKSSQLIEVPKLITCEDINIDCAPVNITNQFSTQSKRVCVYAELSQPLSQDISGAGNWYYRNGHQRELVFHSKLNLFKGDDKFYFWLDASDDYPFDCGRWEFELLLGDYHKKIDFSIN